MTGFIFSHGDIFSAQNRASSTQIRRFVEIILDYCQEQGALDPLTVLEDEELIVDDIVFSLVYRHDVDSDKVFVYASLGEPPESQKSAIYESLLKANLSLYDGRTPTFVFDPDAHEILLAAYLDLNILTAQALHTRLSDLAQQCKVWQQKLAVSTTPEIDTLSNQTQDIDALLDWFQAL